MSRAPKSQSVDPLRDVGRDAARGSWARRALSIGVGLLALGTGLAKLFLWVQAGTAPGARSWSDRWPLAWLALLFVLATTAAWRRSGFTALALALLSWCFALTAVIELPDVPTTVHLGDGPRLIPIYLATGLLAGLYALWARTSADLALRGCALLLLWTCSNAKLFAREAELVFPLLGAAVLLVFGACERRRSWRELWSGPARWVVWIALGFTLWAGLAAAACDNPTMSLSVWLRVAWGALLAWTLAGANLGKHGPDRLYLALIAGAVVVCALLLAGVSEAAAQSSWERVLSSRLRLLDMHSNGIAPYFALSVCLVSAEIVARWAGGDLRGGQPATRVGKLAARVGKLAALRGQLALLGVLALLCVGALARTESRASRLGLGLGLAALALGLSGRLPRRPLRWGIGALGLLAGLAAFLASPLSAGLHERLTRLTWTQSALGQRYHIWRMVAELLRDHPLLGVGPNAKFYAHAQYAQPSYYDYTPQALHAHSLLLGVAEGAGWPGMVLLVLLVLAALELARRAIASADLAPTRAALAQRARRCGLLAGLVAILGCSLLDLGQSRTTFVPLFLWSAIGLCGAWLAGGDEPAGALTHGRARALLALALLVPISILPVTGDLLYARGQRRAAMGQHELALADMERALSVWPLEREPASGLYQVSRALGRRDEALKHLRAYSASRPSRAPQQLSLGRALLEEGLAQEARTVIERAVALDPYGPASGEAHFALGWVCLELGERACAERELLQGFSTEGSVWRALPQMRLPAKPGDPAGARRVAFPVGDPKSPSAILSMDDMLGALETQALELAGKDEIRARRLVGRVVGLWRALGLDDQAFDLLERYSKLVPRRNSNLDALYVELLLKTGRLDEALEAGQASVAARNPNMCAMLARGLLQAGSSEQVALAQSMAGAIDRFEGRDLFFDAGKGASAYGVLMQLALQRGDWDEALRRLRSLLYDCATPEERVWYSQHLYEQCAARAGPERTLLAALGQVLFDCSLDRRLSGDAEAMQRRAGLLSRSWKGDPSELRAVAERACAGLGRAGETFLRALRAEPGKTGG